MMHDEEECVDFTDSKSDGSVKPTNLKKEKKRKMQALEVEEALEPMRIATSHDKGERKCCSNLDIPLLLAIMCCLAGFGVAGYGYYYSNTSKSQQGLHESNNGDNHDFPKELMGTVYKPEDFSNQEGITPSFWKHMHCPDTNECHFHGKTWGPCYPPVNDVNWETVIHESEVHPEPSYHSGPTRSGTSKVLGESLAGYCRPGFIIIGAGKCATSSLYHYLVGHPRVLPANQKQIHYFKYYPNYNMEWYLGHFPTTESFLSSGALMTGEASPGYLPYPDVSKLVADRLPGPKIVVIGRDPLDRSWSSYKYNYVTPALERLRRGRHHAVGRGKSDEEYQKYLFTFEELVRAELKNLRDCLKPGGRGELHARNDWYKYDWAKAEFDRRQHEGMPALIELDKHCYGNTVSKTVPRAQWTELVAKNPDKIINMPNIHLVQSIIGRSLYTLPLEWWYANFPSKEIYFVCTEELRDVTGEPMNELGQFLGLPSFNFSDVVGEGMYNVGFNQGYDKPTSWEDVEKAENSEDGFGRRMDKSEIPLPDDLRKEVLEFIQPYNERLFKLTGRTCNWE
mmetsp:Transcript_28140/g.39587  ORF Transcript_28140/g.39587 Transcript_28140/m.39587 type:complete len:566 (-) Transcript_28140:1409-3106(-)